MIAACAIFPDTLGFVRSPNAAFGWYNEFEAHTVDLRSFAIDVYKVTNGQYAEFVRAGGYENRSLWTETDWDWKTKNGICKPVFWARRGGQWFYRTMFEEIPLPLDWPVYVSHAEASAYARWVGKVLPTEAQFHRVAYGTPEGSERMFPWGADKGFFSTIRTFKCGWPRERSVVRKNLIRIKPQSHLTRDRHQECITVVVDRRQRRYKDGGEGGILFTCPRLCCWICVHCL